MKLVHVAYAVYDDYPIHKLVFLLTLCPLCGEQKLSEVSRWAAPNSRRAAPTLLACRGCKAMFEESPEDP